ncbi:hypothetical protein GCO76_00265 [Rickettsia sp. R2]
MWSFLLDPVVKPRGDNRKIATTQRPYQPYTKYKLIFYFVQF